MPALVVPPSGLSLEGSRASPVPDIFSLQLRDSVIEDMIKCYNSGKTLQLSLGEHPSLQYGSKTQHLSTSIEPFTHELFGYSNSNSQSDPSSPSSTTNPDEMERYKLVKENRIKPSLAFLGRVSAAKFAAAEKKLVPSTIRVYEPVASDPAVAALQNSLASENAKKAENTTKYIKNGAGLPAPGRRGGPPGKAAGKSKLLSQNRALPGDTARSMPSSPALSGAGSPSLGPTSVPLSQQQLTQAKAARKPVVHLLALAPMTEVALRDKIPSASNSDLKQALQKVGDLNQSTGRWELRKPFYKELDVWTFEYATGNDRQKAIDNAVKQYDKMRLGVSEPEWDRLLPQAERGTGKRLSKLQAQIAQGAASRAPKTSVQKPESSNRDGSNGEDEGVSSDKNPASTKTESTTRPATHLPPAKAKKVVEKVVQTKRWMSAKNASKPKPSPVKRERANAKHGKFLSAEYIHESDDEDDEEEEEAPAANPAPKSTKRSREDEGETSDSSIPLSKKLKEDHAHRTSDASQSSRTFSTASPNLSKAKGNSPQKSSPLSSPPTNASEFESSSGHISSSASPAHHIVKGRHSPIYKRHQKSSSVTSSVSSSSHRSLNPEVVDLARRYRSFYPKYEALHREVANSGGRRNLEREQELLQMHERLSELKKQILTGIVYVEN